MGVHIWDGSMGRMAISNLRGCRRWTLLGSMVATQSTRRRILKLQTFAFQIWKRSVKYTPDCSCPSRAGVPAWAVGVAILVVLLVAVAIFVIYRRRRSNHEAVPANEEV